MGSCCSRPEIVPETQVEPKKFKNEQEVITKQISSTDPKSIKSQSKKSLGQNQKVVDENQKVVDEINVADDISNKSAKIKNSKTDLKSKSSQSITHVQRPDEINISKIKPFKDPKIVIIYPDTPDEVEEIPLKICYHNPESWKQLLSRLTGNDRLREMALAKTRLDFKNMKAVKKYFKDLPAKDEIEKAWMIYLWVTDNFEYDGIGLKNDTKGEQDPESILKLGKCVCEGYGTILRDICDAVGLKSEAISGQTKDLKYKYGDNFGVGHKWSAIKIDNYWYPCDPTWGAGNLDDDYNFVKKFNPYFFFTPPQFLLTDHFGETFKINEGKMTLEEFKYEPTFELKFHVLNLKLLSNVKGNITSACNPIVIEFFVPNDVIVSGALKTENQNKIENCVLVQKDSKNLKCAVIAILPENNTSFFLTISAKTVGSESSTEVAMFLLTCDDTKIINKIPKYYLNFEKDLECVSHYIQLLFVDQSPFTLEFSAPKKTLILPNLYKFKNESKLNDCVFVQRNAVNNNYAVIVIFPNQFETYSLEIFARYDSDEGSTYSFVGKFILICKITKTDQDTPKYQIEFDKGLKLLQPSSLIQKIDASPHVLEFSAPKNTLILPSLYKLNSQSELNNCVIVQRNSLKNKYALIIQFPDSSGTYSLEIFARYDSDEGSTYSFVGKFILICKITKTDQDTPKYQIEFDKGLKLLQPSSLIQKIDASPHVLEFSAPKNTLILPSLYKLNSQSELNNCVIVQRNAVNNNFAVIIFFPSQFETYLLKMFARYDSDEGSSYSFVGEFRLFCKITKTNKEIPKYMIEFQKNLKTLKPSSLLQFVDASPHVLELSAPKSIEILADIYTDNDIKIPDRCLIQRDSSNYNYAVITSFPEPKSTYKLNLFAKDSSQSSSSYPYAGELRLICDIQKENKAMPKMKIAFDLGLECLSHYSSIIYADKNPIEMEFNSPENVKFLMDLQDDNNQEIEGRKLLQKCPITNKLKLLISLPNESGKYFLRIFGKNNSTEKSFKFLGKFTLEKSSNFIYRDLGFPKIFSVDFDFYIYEPIDSTLKVAERYTFKVYVTGVKKVAVVIGSDWYYLDEDDEEDNVWIRDITIKNADTAEIVGCLTGKNPTIAQYKLV